MTNIPTTPASAAQYLTEKGLLQDQMYQVLKVLNDKGMVASSSALDTIINAFTKLEKSPDFRITDNIYCPVQHKIVNQTVEPMNFALSHVAVMSEKKEIYMFLDNNKLIFVYELTDKFDPQEVYFFLISILEDPDHYNLSITPLLDPDQEAIEEIIGVPLIN